MSLLTIAIVSHVVVAVIGVGLVGAVPLAAGAMRRAGLDVARGGAVLRPVLSALRASLGIAFLSGALVEYAAHGAFHETAWFRGSVLLVVLIAIFHRRVGAALRNASAPAPVALRTAEGWGWAMCGAVAAVVFLMTAKPF
ncbi:MAG TPA: hypothetical protein VL400_06120 [Polyangiaceae bacterium]|nr:hypothetical protein [Polyangiaceae bacterium]